MTTLTVTAKGQVTLRKELLNHLGVAPGDRIDVEKLPDGRIEMRAARPKGRISNVYGLIKPPPGVSVAIDDIGEIAARDWSGEFGEDRR